MWIGKGRGAGSLPESGKRLMKFHTKKQRSYLFTTAIIQIDGFRYDVRKYAYVDEEKNEHENESTGNGYST